MAKLFVHTHLEVGAWMMIDIFPPKSPDSRTVVRIVIDGREDEQGRALHLISSLHLCGPRLTEVSIDVVGATAPVVPVAALALGYDTGAQVRLVAAEEGQDVLIGAKLFVSVTFNRSEHLLLDAARRRAIPAVVAVQFPLRDKGNMQAIKSAKAAHDTRHLADLIAARLWK